MAIVACVSLGEVHGPFRGHVIDHDTRHPLAGVVILAVWNTLASTPLGHGRQAFYDSRETLSDARGYFEIPRLPFSSQSVDVQAPELFFFAPGYVLVGPNLLSGPIPARAVRVRTSLPYAWEVEPQDGQAFVAATTVLMRPIRSTQEWCRHLFYLPPLLESMAAKMPLMMNAIAKERVARGLCP